MRQFINRGAMLLALFTLLLPVTVLAQTSRTTGAITGTVTDPQGNGLPGVTITVTSPNLQGTRTAVTNSDGTYDIPSLPVGTYRAEYALSGVSSSIREGIRVSAGASTGINVPMSMSMSETVTVTASQVVVDPTRATTQHTMDEEHLKYTAVGSANRSYQNVLAQAPGVVGGGNPQVAGANLANNDWYVDGVNTTDPVTHTFGGNMPFDAIQEITVTTFGKDAEYKSSGGTVNVITKSGTNDFEGSFDVRYNDPSFLEAGKEKRYAAPTVFGGPVGAEQLRFNKAVQTAKSEQPQATLGGPILRDRLWFFGSGHRPLTIQQAPNTLGFQPGPRQFSGYNWTGKLTFTPFSNHTLTGKYADSNAVIEHSQFLSTVPSEADSQQVQASWIYALSYDGVLSSTWLANLQYSHRPSELTTQPQSGDLQTPGVINNANNVRSVNYTNYQSRTSERNELTASTTYYMDRFGSHAFKVGGTLDENSFVNYGNYTFGNPSLIPGFDASLCGPASGLPAGQRCGASIRLNVALGGGVIVPQRVILSTIPNQTTVGANTTSFYVQDEWRPIPRLTARVGLRYDSTEWDTDGGLDIPSFEFWQPRLGLAFDVFNNANTVIHAYGGKIADENQLTLPNYGVNSGFSATRNFDLNPATGLYTRNTVGETTSAGGFSTDIDPDLHGSFSNQYSLGFTQRIFRNTSLDVTGEYRTTKGLFEDYCGELADGGFEHCIVTNSVGPAGTPQPLRSNYRGIITKIESRPYTWLDLQFSHVRAWSRGSTESTQNADASFDYYDIHFRNTYGFLSDDARDRVKLNGYARLPLDFIVGTSYTWRSGLAYSVFQTAPGAGYGTHYLEPRGSRRTPALNQLDLQLQKNFTFRQVTFGVIGSVINVLNSETANSYVGQAGTRAISDPANPTRIYVDPNQTTGANRFAANFLQQNGWQLPRRYEVGVRFEF